jgi:uncharacterized protein
MGKLATMGFFINPGAFAIIRLDVMNRPFSLLVKPASADCNLTCDYCFYLDRKELYPETQRHRMNEEVLERMIETYMKTDQPNYSFGWQGGEPTLMGADFFRKVTKLQERHGKAGSIVSNGLQTNATLITEELARHLAKYRFLVGVSLDGPTEIHDTFRTTRGGSGSHSTVMEGITILNRHGVDYNVLVLVSSANVKKPREIYRYLVSRGAYFHQYIPCVEFSDDGSPLPYSVSGEQWGRFLIEIFEEWETKDTRRVSIRLFDSLLGLLVDGRPNVCHLDKNCCQYFVVEHNGDVYPCDFFVQADLTLGNVLENSWDEMLSSEIYRDFGAMKDQWNARCRSCRFLTYCAGDCLKNRFYGGEDPEKLSYLCRGLEMFYERSLAAFEKIASGLREERARAARIGGGFRAPSKNPGRNDPCFCGSGKKYKHCHGR